MAPKRIPEIPGLETDPDGSEVKPDGCREREREREDTYAGPDRLGTACSHTQSQVKGVHMSLCVCVCVREGGREAD